MQLVVALLVESFPPLEEGAWRHLLVYEGGDNQGGYEGHDSLQLLDREQTHELMLAFAATKQPEMQAPPAWEQEWTEEAPPKLELRGASGCVEFEKNSGPFPSSQDCD